MYICHMVVYFDLWLPLRLMVPITTLLPQEEMKPQVDSKIVFSVLSVLYGKCMYDLCVCVCTIILALFFTVYSC